MSSREAVLDLLQENARYSVEDMARQLDAEPAAVRDTIDQLEAEGVLRGYRAVIDWGERDDEPIRAAVELNVVLDRETSYDEVAERIAKFPPVEALHLVSGEYDLLMEVEGQSMSELSNFISNKVAPVPEITQTVTHYIMDTYKEQGIELGEHGEDDRLSVSP